MFKFPGKKLPKTICLDIFHATFFHIFCLPNTMDGKIHDRWELYSYPEFKLRKSLLKEHIQLYENCPLFDEVNLT